MSQSPVTVTYSLEEVLKQITLKVEVKVGQAKLEEKIDSLNKRLEFQEFINKGVLVGLVVVIHRCRR